MGTVKNEPVAIGAVLVPIIVWLATRYGIDMTAETASAVAGVVLVIGGAVARMLVRTKRTLPDPDAVKPGTT
jgi:hypothetical protein